MDDITLKINDAGHDMTFVIEKMSAFKAEGWLIRAGLLLGREAITAEGVKDYRGLVAALCKVEYEKAAPLLDELLQGARRETEEERDRRRHDSVAVDAPDPSRGGAQGELRFFAERKPVQLPRWAGFRADCEGVRGVASYANIPPLAGRLISARLASLAELKTVLTYEDAVNLDEVLLLDNYHKWLAAKQAEEKI